MKSILTFPGSPGKSKICEIIDFEINQVFTKLVPYIHGNCVSWRCGVGWGALGPRGPEMRIRIPDGPRMSELSTGYRAKVTSMKDDPLEL